MRVTEQGEAQRCGGSCGRSHPLPGRPLGSFPDAFSWLLSPGADPTPTTQADVSHQSPTLAILAHVAWITHPRAHAACGKLGDGPQLQGAFAHPATCSQRTNERPVRVLRELLSLKMTPSYPEFPPSFADLRKPLRKESWNPAHHVVTLGESSGPQFVHLHMRGLREMPKKVL